MEPLCGCYNRSPQVRRVKNEWRSGLVTRGYDLGRGALGGRSVGCDAAYNREETFTPDRGLRAAGAAHVRLHNELLHTGW